MAYRTRAARHINPQRARAHRSPRREGGLRPRRKWDDAAHAISAMDDGVAQIEPSVAHLLSASQVHARRCERAQA